MSAENSATGQAEQLRINLQVWRQAGPDEPGQFEAHVLVVSPETSFLEMLDVLNEGLMRDGREPVAFDHDWTSTRKRYVPLVGRIIPVRLPGCAHDLIEFGLGQTELLDDERTVFNHLVRGKGRSGDFVKSLLPRDVSSPDQP